MSIFNPVQPEVANLEAKASLDIVHSAFGGTPNLMKMLANSPNVLKGIMAFSEEVASGEIETSLFEQIALLTSAINNCEYCVAVHFYVGQQAGLNREELVANLQSKASNPRSQAVLNFTQEVVKNRGKVDAETVQALRDHGLSDKAIIEVLGVIGLYTFLNYAKHLTNPVLDFPAVPEFPIKTSA
jgi:uncharacterized peroxidase-related enzyme